jgi:7-carboxy-7-deazaguanine synthase
MHEKRRLNYPVMQQYIDGYDYQLKFVVDRKPDINEVRAVITQLQHVDSSRVILMAQGVNQAELNRKAKWIVESCKQYGFSYTPRLHIQLFGNRRGT